MFKEATFVTLQGKTFHLPYSKISDGGNKNNKPKGVYAFSKDITPHFTSVKDKWNKTYKLLGTESVYISLATPETVNTEKIFNGSTFKRTIHPSLANIIILDDLGFRYTGSGSYYVYAHNHAKLKALLNGKYMWSDDAKSLDDIFNEKIDTVITGYDRHIDTLINNIPEAKDYFRNDNIIYYNYHGYKDDIKIIENIIKCNQSFAIITTSANFFEAWSLSKEVIIDEETYNSFLEILQSRDYEGHKLVYNILNNCNWNKSLFWIMMLTLYSSGNWLGNTPELKIWLTNNIKIEYYNNSSIMKFLYNTFSNDEYKIRYLKNYMLNIVKKEVLGNHYPHFNKLFPIQIDVYEK